MRYLKKTLSKQEWVYNYLKSRKIQVPLVLGTRGTWCINEKKAIILVALTILDIMVIREMHNVVKNPIRKVKYKDIVYLAVNIVDKKQVEYLIEYWKDNSDN